MEPESDLFPTSTLELGSNLAGGFTTDPESNLANQFQLEPEENLGIQWPGDAGERTRGVGSRMEEAVAGRGKEKEGGALLPPSVDDMGAEATIRFLKAKLQVMQEEMDRLCEEMNQKVSTLDFS